jgi:hypothetical protein
MNGHETILKFSDLQRVTKFYAHWLMLIDERLMIEKNDVNCNNIS